MAARASSQVQVETLIARGRLVLAVFSLALRPTRRAAGRIRRRCDLVGVSRLRGLLALLVRTRFGDGPRWPGATHAIDLSVYAVCLFLLGGLAPAMLAWFLFVLVAATLRWGWRGTLTTGSVAVAVHVGFGARAAELIRDPAMAPSEFITLALLMGVMTMLVGLVGAYEDWRGRSWRGWRPGRVPIRTARRRCRARCSRRPPLVLEAPRTLLVWEEADEPWTEFALWADGRVERFREPPGTFGDVVAERVRDSELFLPQPDRRSAGDLPSRTAQGLVSWNGMPVDPAIPRAVCIRALAGWPLRGEDFADGSSASTSRASRCRT